MGANGAGGGYNLENSLRFRSSASAYLSRTPATAGNSQIFTLSLWVKKGDMAASYGGLYGAGTWATDDDLLMFSGNYIRFWARGSLDAELITNAIYRDPSAWYHIIVAVDTTQATAANRVKMYVNGEQITSFQTEVYPALNYNFVKWNSTVAQEMFVNPNNNYFDGYATEVNFVDGQALTQNDFGETNEDTGVWQPIKYTGSYGTNGFYLKGRGTDNSGNGNNFTENNFNTTNSALTTYDIMTDVPTLTDEDTANYAVINPLDLSIYTANSTLDGNLSFKNTTTNANGCGRATIGVSSGKWYWETTVTALGGVYPDLGILGSTQPFSDNTQTYIAGFSTGYAYRGSGNKGNNASVVAYGAAYTTGDVIGTALDLDAGTITFYKNNVSQGVAYTGLSGQFSPAWANYASGVFTANFGQRPFKYTPPAGYKKLNTFNLPDSSIEDGSENFNTVLFTGDGTNDRFISTGFSTDFTWLKNRGTTNSHYLSDTVRGNEKAVNSNTTAAEFDYSPYGGLSFSTGGITVDTGTSNVFNTSGGSFVTWNWLAGGTAVSNTAGTITSQVSANPTAGFSIATYTGTGNIDTVGHGLNVQPDILIVKTRTQAQGWIVYTKLIDGSNDALFLNTTDAAGDSGFSGATPTVFDFNLGASIWSNTAGRDYVMYSFASVEGYSKMGTYIGNGSADGPFVYTGFRPAYIMIKRTNGVANWVVLDATRDSYNVGGLELFPNTSGAENNNSPEIDFLSNGVKLRWTYSGTNASGGTYIYMAFAESPFKVSLAR